MRSQRLRDGMGGVRGICLRSDVEQMALDGVFAQSHDARGVGGSLAVSHCLQDLKFPRCEDDIRLVGLVCCQAADCLEQLAGQNFDGHPLGVAHLNVLAGKRNHGGWLKGTMNRYAKTVAHSEVSCFAEDEPLSRLQTRLV